MATERGWVAARGEDRNVVERDVEGLQMHAGSLLKCGSTLKLDGVDGPTALQRDTEPLNCTL